MAALAFFGLHLLVEIESHSPKDDQRCRSWKIRYVAGFFGGYATFVDFPLFGMRLFIMKSCSH